MVDNYHNFYKNGRRLASVRDMNVHTYSLSFDPDQDMYAFYGINSGGPGSFLASLDGL
jgi:hypothetical protein